MRTSSDSFQSEEAVSDEASLVNPLTQTSRCRYLRFLTREGDQEANRNSLIEYPELRRASLMTIDLTVA